MFLKLITLSIPWITVGMMLSGALSCLFLYMARRRIANTIDMMELSCGILRDNPEMLVVSAALMAVYAVFVLIWTALFENLFLLGSLVPASNGSVWWRLYPGSYILQAYFVFVLLWTSSVFKNIQLFTVADASCRWYFSE